MCMNAQQQKRQNYKIIDADKYLQMNATDNLFTNTIIYKPLITTSANLDTLL